MERLLERAQSITRILAEDYPLCSKGHEYAYQVLKGEIPAGLHVHRACKRQITDLYREDLPYTFEPRRAERVLKFIQKLPHVKDVWAKRKELIVLTPWQCFCISVIFGWISPKGTRRFVEAFIEVPRKNAKSTLASAVALYCFVADNEHGAEVFCGATTYKQAFDTIFSVAKGMVKKSKGFVERFGIEVLTNNLAIPKTNSKFEPLCGKPGEGASPSCVIIDEYHEHQTAELYDSMVTGMGARSQPLLFIITTAGVDLSSPCFEKHNQCARVLEGTLVNDRLFTIIYDSGQNVDWTSQEALVIANPNLGASVQLDYLEHRQREAMSSVYRQNTFKAKHLNIWSGSASSWMNLEKWRAQPARKSLDELEGRPCFIGIDMASKVDIAAMAIFFPPVADDLVCHLHCRFYLPEDIANDNGNSNASHYSAWVKQGFITITDGDVTDQRKIIEDLQTFCQRFDVQEIPFDPREMAFMSTAMLDEGLPMVEFPQTTLRMSEPMKHFESLVYGHTLAHGDDPVLTWMVSNVVVRTTQKMIHPAKIRHENKIDGIIAAIMAVARYMSNESKSGQYDGGLVVI
jgi:phage terminase large subunit-like protein